MQTEANTKPSDPEMPGIPVPNQEHVPVRALLGLLEGFSQGLHKGSLGLGGLRVKGHEQTMKYYSGIR